METVSQQFCHLWNCAGAVVRKAVLSVYGNGMLPLMVMVGNLTKLPKTICNRFMQPLMEMLDKQFSPFMEMVVQPSLTARAIASYGLWKWLASSSLRLWKWLVSSSSIYGTGCNQQHTRPLLVTY
jgi:hypothetical protein